MYGFVAEEEPVQFVTFRVEAVGLVLKAPLTEYPLAGEDVSAALCGHRDVWFSELGGFVTCPLYDRDRLRPGNRLVGPAVIEQMDTTTVVLPRMTALVDAYLNLLLEFA